MASPLRGHFRVQFCDTQFTSTCIVNGLFTGITVANGDVFSNILSTFNTFNSLPNDKILDLYKLKAFADDKINVSEKSKFLLERIENIVITSIFFLFPQCFQNDSYNGSLKVGIVW